ncbi:cell division cycle-related protein [Rhodotorula kratochvilovae]
MAQAVHPVSASEPVFVRALYSYSGADSSSLSFRQGDILEVLSVLDSGWWDGVVLQSGTRGWFPSNYTEPIAEDEAMWATSGAPDSRRGSVASNLSRSTSEHNDASEAGLIQSFDAHNLGGPLSRDPTLQDFINGGEFDLTSFSAGGDIFSEIAAAAAQDDPASAGAPSMSRQQSAASHAPSSAASVHPGDALEDEDFWVPKMTHAGQLFYYNTRTGETSRDMPIDGQGDGVRIDPAEYTLDARESAARRASLIADGGARRASVLSTGAAGEWSERSTEDGRSSYFVNLRTGEQMWEPPSSSSGSGSNMSRRSSVRQRAPAGDAASLLSSWTERPSRSQPADVVEQDEHDAASVTSDDSALDAAFAPPVMRERGAEQDGAGAGEGLAAPTPPFPRKASTAAAELLGAPPPPLIADLEEIASRALQELVSAVGLGGVVGPEGRDRAAERERLVEVGNEVVHAIRVVLHSAGALEHSVTASAFASSVSPVNEIHAPYPHSYPLTPQAHAELRPFSRRLISTLSKLTFSIRAMWGLLETTEEDLYVSEDDSPADPDEILRRAQARQQTLAERRAVRDIRFEHETRLRSEVLQGAQDVNDQVAAFLQQFQRVALTLSAARGAASPALDALRATKPLQGSLRTEAGALLLPGGGFGGNWRGNGFVSLPTPPSRSRVSSSAAPERPLGYAWPNRPIAKDVVDELRRAADGVAMQAGELSARVGDAPLALFPQAAALQKRLAAFLAQVEDVDVAAGVDFQLPPEDASRPTSTGTGAVSLSSDAASSTTARYKASVLEARPLLADLEARKQALYDVAPRLLFALQSAVATAQLRPAGAVAGQPRENDPLAVFATPALSSPSPAALQPVLDDLAATLPALCSTFVSLAGIAEMQSSAPGHLRSTSRSYRMSMFGSSTAESVDTHARFSHGQESTVPSSAPSVRDSVDSDFFFSGTLPDPRRNIAGTSASLLVNSTAAGGTVRSQASTSSGGTRAPLPFAGGGVEVLSGGSGGGGTMGGLPPGWDSGARRGSVATTQTTSSGGAMSTQSALGGFAEYGGPPQATLSPSRSSSKNIQKLLGEGAPVDGAGVVQEVRPWFLERDWGDDELSFTMENTIKGGTLRGLVIAATSHEGRVDSSYLSAFLMTYRTFCTSHQLLDELIDRYTMHEPEELTGDEFKEWELKKLRPVRARVTNLLKAWVREYMDNEDLDRELLQRIREFALNTMTEKGQSLQICKSVDERMQGAARRPVGNLAPGPLPPPILPRNLKKFKLTDIEPLELARQLTIMDGRLFQRITAQECLGKAWPKQFGGEAANISAMIDMSNAVTRWVTETILAQDDLKKRATIIKHFVALAERCLSLNNFSTLIHIIAGLNSTPIHRLRRTWEAVSQKAMITLGALNNIMRPDKNYKEYRDILRKSAPPCVPFLGVYLTDWTFIGDGNSDFLREKPHQINFHKRQKASELILMIKLHQATTYNLQAVPPIANFLQDKLFPQKLDDPDKEDQRLYEISLALEPRERDDEKIARLLSESGFL